LVMELRLRGISVVPQASFSVSYKDKCVGEYCADILVAGKLVVELKCVDRFTKEHLAQCLNYLRASGLNLCLLVNFQKPVVEWKRVVWNL